MTAHRGYNVLFLCTGNSARSILAEAALGSAAAGRFQAFSAGSQPSGKVQPFAREIALSLGYPEEKMRSKSWDEFAEPGAPEMDLILTVCDNAAGEACPVWLGHPATAHWGVPDPVEVEGSDEVRRHAFQQAYQTLRLRIELLLALPIETLDRQQLQARLREIGQVKA
jgi:arsenate reductase